MRVGGTVSSAGPVGSWALHVIPAFIPSCVSGGLGNKTSFLTWVQRLRRILGNRFYCGQAAVTVLSLDLNPSASPRCCWRSPSEGHAQCHPPNSAHGGKGVRGGRTPQVEARGRDMSVPSRCTTGRPRPPGTEPTLVKSRGWGPTSFAHLPRETGP